MRMLKARFSEALTARSDRDRNAEMNLMAVAHNVLIALRRSFSTKTGIYKRKVALSQMPLSCRWVNNLFL